MPGWDDPRYAQQKFEELERRLKKLEGSSQPFATQQQGPMPGYVRALVINDPRAKASMWANYSNVGPGQGPYSAVTDANGVIRVEWGNLAANGVSPAQEGFRVNDANGVPIIDSLGVIGPMTVLGQQSSGVLNQTIAGPVTAATVNSSSLTFSLPRQLRVLSFYSAIFSMVTGGAGFCYVNARMDGSDAGANNHHFMVAGGGFANSVMGFNVRVDLLSAGSHTADITADVDASTSEQVFKTGLYVFQLGS